MRRVAPAFADCQTLSQQASAYTRSTVEAPVRVLIVEDEPFLADSIQAGLRHEAIAADIALDGDGALERLSSTTYDIVLLDRDIPGVHGDDVCRVVTREHPGVRVLMLTAASRLKDKVGGFALGADDYLTKPFAFEELVVRLRALERRPAAAIPRELEFADLRLDPFRREVYRSGRYVRLARKQFAVLELLMRAAGGVVSAETLLEKAWDEHADPFTSAPRVTISTLRKALGEPDLIETVAGVGYRLSETPGRDR
jgi:two-component system response regulator VanR